MQKRDQALTEVEVKELISTLSPLEWTNIAGSSLCFGNVKINQGPALELFYGRADLMTVSLVWYD